MKMRAGMGRARGAKNKPRIAKKSDCLPLADRAIRRDRNTIRDHMRIPAHNILSVIDNQFRTISSVISFLAHEHRFPGRRRDNCLSIRIAPILRKIQSIVIFIYMRGRRVISLGHDESLPLQIRQLDGKGCGKRARRRCADNTRRDEYHDAKRHNSDEPFFH